MRLFRRAAPDRLNPQQFGQQLRLFKGYEVQPSTPSWDLEKVFGPPTGRDARGNRYWQVGESSPGSHPGQGQLFTNDDLRRAQPERF